MTTFYIEKSVRDHPRTAAIMQRQPQADVVDIDRYGQVFNPKAQNFRLQKLNPAWVLAEKSGRKVLPAPYSYGFGSQHNFYFSHMQNCLYDCRYCFLQGMYRSAHYLLFVNYEDFIEELQQTWEAIPRSETVWFYSGYDCDSLALEPLTGFMEFVLPWFADKPNAQLEIRTKSTQIRQLLQQEPLNNVLAAFSFTPSEIHQTLEHGVPSIEKRLQALCKLGDAGWRLGLRFDPMIASPDWETQFEQLLQQLFAALNPEWVENVSIGAFRLPDDFYRNMVKLYPLEPLLADPRLQSRNKMIGYSADQEQALVTHAQQALLRYLPAQKVYPCSYD